MSKREIFNIRLNEREHGILMAYAKQRNVSASEVLRDYIKSLESQIEPKKRGKK